MLRLIVCLIVGLFTSLTYAQQNPAPVKRAIENWLKIQTQGLPGQVSFEIGELDPANQLTPCASFDISRHASAQPWGRSNVMVRCTSKAGWRVYVPVHVRVKADYLVSARPIAQGQEIVEEDLTTQLGDLSELPAQILTDPARAIGKAAGTSISTGRPLRADMLKAMTVIRRGQTVKVVSRGPGFEVASEGRALNNATEGQQAQVRLSNGQVVSGSAKSGGYIEVNY